MDRSNRKFRPESTFPTHDFSEQSSEDTLEDKFPILDRTALGVVPFRLKNLGRTFGQLEVLQSSYRAVAPLFDYGYYRLLNTRQSLHPREISSTPRRVKNLKTSMTTFEGVQQITMFFFSLQIREEMRP